MIDRGFLIYLGLRIKHCSFRNVARTSPPEPEADQKQWPILSNCTVVTLFFFFNHLPSFAGKNVYLFTKNGPLGPDPFHF